MIDEVGYLVGNENTMKITYKGYCKKCHHTFWSGEIVEKSAGGFNHLDCLRALADTTPRKLSPQYERELRLAGLGIPNKTILKKKAKIRMKREENGTI